MVLVVYKTKNVIKIIKTVIVYSNKKKITQQLNEHIVFAIDSFASDTQRRKKTGVEYAKRKRFHLGSWRIAAFASFCAKTFNSSDRIHTPMGL